MYKEMKKLEVKDLKDNFFEYAADIVADGSLT